MRAASKPVQRLMPRTVRQPRPQWLGLNARADVRATGTHHDWMPERVLRGHRDSARSRPRGLGVAFLSIPAEFGAGMSNCASITLAPDDTPGGKRVLTGHNNHRRLVLASCWLRTAVRVSPRYRRG